MDLQTRKLNAIEYLINLNDESLFKIVEATIDSTKSQKNIKAKSLTKKQLVYRAKLSNQDYLSGKYKTQEQLELESKNW
ncbi:MAG: hypothetical protein A2033_06380 [Bacteroidetes bacterium GWA2_31_9]|nr:MAG: hypothetical protein A2033_06380 [Bacteroidetes bacterium GWA2_31_9]